jgi:hypothetical protein
MKRRAKLVLALFAALPLGACAVGVAGGTLVSDGRTTTVETRSATVDGRGLTTERTRTVAGEY